MRLFLAVAACLLALLSNTSNTRADCRAELRGPDRIVPVPPENSNLPPAPIRGSNDRLSI